MKGLLKYLSPFAPDQSGATSVFYDLGGIIVICDAGGCAGNVCGFDEPRWFKKRSAIFSAGLRDMDAILGRDDKLVKKLQLAAKQLQASFAVAIGTPVPAVIATDFRAIRTMAEKTCGFPVVTIACTGTRLYDEGAEDAWFELFQTFAKGKEAETVLPAMPEQKRKILGIIGMTPLDISMSDPASYLEKYHEDYDEVRPYAMGAGIDLIRRAGEATENLVVSPAGLKAAKYLKKKYGTDYRCAFPFLPEEVKARLRMIQNKKVLVVAQQVEANEIRSLVTGCDVTCSTWFMKKKELEESGDVRFRREDEFRSYVLENSFDVIIGDGLLQRAIREYDGEYIELAHFAISGELYHG